MLFSHISDTHLGLTQYGTDERTIDVYDAFNQAINISIKDHVDFVIFAGDIFHVPNPNGDAIMQMADGLKKLRQYNIDSFFILGEHDISRIRSTPIPFVYHKLGFTKYIGHGEVTEYKGISIVGYDKIRRAEISQFEEKFSAIDKLIENVSGHKILVLHQGVTEFNKFAGEIQSTDLPKNFTYYAMGHLHDKDIRRFGHLNGPVAYPGSIELTNNERINNVKKGFFEVDISNKDANPNWIKLDTREHMSYSINYVELSKTIKEIHEKLSSSEKMTDTIKKPVIEIRITGDDIKTDHIQTEIAKLNTLSLRCFWKIITKDNLDSSVYLDRPNVIDDEMFKLSTSILGSEQAAKFAIKDLLPILESGNVDEATKMIIDNYEKFKKESRLQ